jgi:hypothetical protein
LDELLRECDHRLREINQKRENEKFQSTYDGLNIFDSGNTSGHGEQGNKVSLKNMTEKQQADYKNLMNEGANLYEEGEGVFPKNTANQEIHTKTKKRR